jgi:electron transfer flavoprotein beta subunit|tara:strand:+ start:52130 stop:52870 length:741 start_codon:yes stop_codon:yes gene_type:complete
MNILICISCVPDTTSKISFTDNDTKFNSEGVQYIVGPYEDYALARAVELKEKDNSIHISVLNVGLANNDPLLRKALAVGADDAFRINIFPNNSLHVANQIASFIKENNFDLILMGKESIDFNSAQVHYLTGSILNIPSLSPVTELNLNLKDQKILIKKEIDDGIETLEVVLPAILGCQEPIAEWKIPNMRGIMNARIKPLKVIESFADESKVNFSKFIIPEKKENIKIIDENNINELIKELKLKNL